MADDGVGRRSSSLGRPPARLPARPPRAGELVEKHA